MSDKPHIVSLREGLRLDRYLTRQLSHVSRNRVQFYIQKGDVLVNGRQVRVSHRLQGGEELTFATRLTRDFDRTAEAVPLEIIHEDAHLLVINKPADLLVHPVGMEFSRTVVGALHVLLRQRGESTEGLGIIHRLDRMTSGLMVLGKTLLARRFLSRQVEERRVKREYVAIAAGVPPARRGTVCMPIRRHPRRPSRMQALTPEQAQEARAVQPVSRVSDSGYSNPRDDLRPRDATTHYAVLRHWQDCSLLRLRLETGRTHQIRVHAQAIGVPLLGYPIYGPSLDHPAQRFKLGRPALHARRLSFPHPETGELLRFRLPLPDDLQALLQQIAAAGDA
jgi:23S rRNA pseudouridine1911/1915/1917 synthase